MLEQLLMSLKVIVLGFGTVFVALVALIYVIELVNKVLNIDYKFSKKQDIQAGESIEKLEESAENSAGFNESEIIHDEDQEEIIAVITAAIAASLNRSTHDIVVKSVRRVPYHTPVWNRTGRNQQIAGRL